MTKGMIFAFFFLAVLVTSIPAEDARITKAREALEDGLPQVAIYRLKEAENKWPSPQDKVAADLLLGRAQFSAGRFAEAAAILEKIPQPNPKADFWLAEAFAALGRSDAALPLYQKLVGEKSFSEKAVIGEARMLAALNRKVETPAVLSAFLEKNPGANDVALELSGVLVDAGNGPGVVKALSFLKDASIEQQKYADYLRARAAMLSADYASAENNLKGIQDPPARLAAEVAVSLAESQLQQKDAGEAEKTLETFVEENSRLPGLDRVFATLDRVYAAQNGASSSELRKWGDDGRDPGRAALAKYYEARNEARLGHGEKSRRIFADFLAENPGHILADPARVQLSAAFLALGDAGQALQIARHGQGAKTEFQQGLALAALGQYKEAAACFLKASRQQDIATESLANSTICGILADIPDEDNPAMKKLHDARGGAEILKKILFYEALHEAGQRKSGAEKKLRQIARSDSPWSQRARLAVAEWDNLQLDLEGARAELRKISSKDPAEKERADCLAVFLADTGDPESGAEVGNLAEAFLKTHRHSSFEPEVRMKLGEMLFRRGDYLGAHGQFIKIAGEFPDSPMAEKATFLSAQAMSRSLSPQAMEQAIEIYNDVAKDGGSLALRARLSQAMLFNSLGRPKDALGVLENIVSSNPDAELRNMALVEQGDTWFSLGVDDPQNFSRAIESWQKIVSDSSASKEWNHQALVKMGGAYAKLGNNDAALDCYYRVFSQDQKGQPEYFWFYKAGFEAGSLLERQKLWKEAIAVYEKIGSFDGPRAGEARDRVNKLRLENFIWEN